MCQINALWRSGLKKNKIVCGFEEHVVVFEKILIFVIVSSAIFHNWTALLSVLEKHIFTILPIMWATLPTDKAFFNEKKRPKRSSKQADLKIKEVNLNRL